MATLHNVHGAMPSAHLESQTKQNGCPIINNSGQLQTRFSTDTNLELGLHEAQILLVIGLGDNVGVLNSLRLDLILQPQVLNRLLMDVLQRVLVNISAEQQQTDQAFGHQQICSCFRLTNQQFTFHTPRPPMGHPQR